MALGDTPNSFQEKFIDRLFGKLQAMYGDRWSYQFHSQSVMEVTRQQWREALVRWRVTGQQVARALDLCVMTHTRPPTLPEFIQLAVEMMIPAHRKYIPDKSGQTDRQAREGRLRTGREALKSITDMLNNNEEDNHHARR